MCNMDTTKLPKFFVRYNKTNIKKLHLFANKQSPK